MFRQQLTEEAIAKVERKRRKDLKKLLVKKGLRSELELKEELSQAPLPTHTNTSEEQGGDAATATRTAAITAGTGVVKKKPVPVMQGAA